MKRKNPIILSLLIILGLGLIIFLPVNVLTENLSSYGEIEKKISFSCNPVNISKLSDLKIESCLGDVNIEYEYPPLEYAIRVDVSINMAGKGLANKSYLDYFNISFDYDETYLSMLINLKSKFSLSLIRDFQILIKINAEAFLDISAKVEYGNINFNAPFAVNLKGLDFNITEGNLYYDFTECFIDGVINGYNNLGDLIFTAVDLQYSQDAYIKLANNEGSINIVITQERTMGTNLTGVVRLNRGKLKIDYEDNPEIGAIFTFHNHTTGWGGVDNVWFGFHDPVKVGESGYIFTSYDFPCTNNYNISFYKTLGDYSVNLASL